MNHFEYDFGINLSEIQDIEPFALLPAGEYEAQAIQLNLKDSKSGEGKYLNCEFNIVKGPYANRKIFQNVIVHHPNNDAQRIGLQWIKSWVVSCAATGNERLSLTFLRRFLRQSCLAVVSIEEGSNGYQDKNKITRFKKIVNDCTFDDMVIF